MRHITKGLEPPELQNWIVRQAPTGVNLRYKELDAPVLAALRKSLAAEQFGICAYTGKALRTDTTAIEHVKTQEQCRLELESRGGVYGRDLGEDLSYANMLGVYKTVGVAYGEGARGNKPVPVGPLDPTCEQRFLFTLVGQIDPRDPADVDAETTVQSLDLRHASLTSDRKEVLEGIFPGELLDQFTEAELRTIVEAHTVPVGGVLPEFAFVVRFVALSLLP